MISEIRLSDILKAEEILGGKINKTPLLSFRSINQKLGANVYFKAENLQKTGSFKIRGVLNKLHSLSPAQKKKGVVTMSAGNHAISLAFAALQMNIPCIAVMPRNVKKSKVKEVKKMGAEVILKKNNLWTECLRIQKKRGFMPIHPFGDPWVIAGQGTIGLEILRDLPRANAIFIPIGGGGLISGIATAIKFQNPKVKIIGVEPIGAAAMFESIRQNKMVCLKKIKTIADGLAASSVAEYTLTSVKKYVDELVLVSDKEIIGSLKMLLEQGKMLTEPAGAAAFAALLYQKTRISPRSNVVCVLSGGNIGKEELLTLLNPHI